MPVIPIEGARIPTRGLGAWLARRSEGRRLHAGVDLAMRADTPCRAPESGEVVEVFESNRPLPNAPRFSRPPGWSGYGPRGVLMRGDSGVWHLLAHLDTVLVTDRQRVTEGETVGVGSVVRHVHWEVRTQARPTGGAAVVEVTVDPGAWLRGQLVPWSGQCPENPSDTRDTPRACRPSSSREGGGGGGTPGPTVVHARHRTEPASSLERLMEAARAPREVWDGCSW